MLNENDVIAIVVMYLEESNWKIIQTSNTRQTGPDIKAKFRASNRHLYVEAKGATSALSTSNRYGNPFNRSQVRDHVAKAFYVAACVSEHLSAIAVPRNRDHKHFMEAIRTALNKLKVAVFWVSEDGAVTT